MSKKYFGLLIIIFATFLASTLWRDFRSPSGSKQVVAVAAQPTIAPTEAVTPPSTGDNSTPSTNPPSPTTASLWGKLLSMEGQALDPKILPTKASSDKITVGRVALFEATSLTLERFEQGQEVLIPLPGGMTARGTINLKRTEQDGSIRLGGGLTDANNGSFSLGQSGGRIGGRILLRPQELAYLVSSSSSGEIMVKEVPLAEVLCHPLPLVEDPEPELAPSGSEPMAAPPELRSRPEAVSVLYLDFDGATVTDPDWNSGVTINAAASPLSSTQITQVWNRVKEDFWPFNLNVTTVESDYTNAPPGRRMRVIITPTDTASPGSGGVAFRDSFAGAGGADFSNDIPCWVFNSWTDAIVETISHEAGHTFGLRHDGRSSPVEEYYSGHGGSVSWGPIMGASFYVQLTQWSKGEYPNANNPEDDLAIISGAQQTPLYNLTNNTGVVADDHGDDRAGATALDVSSYSINRAGTIATSSDSDFYSFTVGSSRKLSLSVVPPNTYYNQANLDAQIELQDAAGTVLMSVDPDGGPLGATLTTTVPAGTYYLRVRSAADAADGGYNGYSTYGSIGSYTLSGTLEDVVAPSITSNPQASYNLYAGNNVSLSATAVGTTPVIYQWKRNGAALSNNTRISGATSNYLSITNLTLDDAGTYTMTASNAAGSATTTGSSVVVTLPPAPVFSGGPYSTSVVEGNSLYLYAYASSQVSVTYQWYKDGILQTGQTSSSFSKNPVTFADAGNYWVVATNTGGNTTSTTAVVTVTAASLPVITSHPVSADLFTGQNYYGLSVGVSSNAPVTYKWYRNGAVIAGATYSNYSIYSAATGTHAGEYRVEVTNVAGTVSSSEATISVSSTLPPRITSQPYSQPYATLGSSASLSVNAEGTGPITYQWYRNGVAVVGGTSSYLYLYPITVAHVGEYYVTVSNANGTVQSDTVVLDISPYNPPETYWYEAKEFDGVVYFLFKHSGKIARYDLATESWLAAWEMNQAPTAFTVSNDAVFVAFGTTVRKYSRTFTNATDLAIAPYSVIWMEVANGMLLTAASQGYYDTRFATYNPATGALLDSKTYTYSAGRGFCYSAVTGKIYGRSQGISPGDIHGIAINSNGTIGASSDTPYHGSYPEGIRTFTLGNGAYVGDNGGIVYNASDLSFKGSFGFTFKDAISAGTGYCVLTGTRLYRFDENFQELGRALTSHYGERLAYRGSTIYSFAQPTTGNSQPTVLKTSILDLVPEPPAPIVEGYGQKITPDQVVMGEDGVVYIYNKALRNIFRWSVGARRYLPSLPLVAKPRYLAYSAANRTLYFDNGSTQLKQIDLDDLTHAEMNFYTSPQNIGGLQTAGSHVVFTDPSGAWDSHYVVSAAGALLDSADWNHPSREFTWCAANNRLYFFRDDSSPNDLMYEVISNAGEITGAGETPYHGGVTTNVPIRVAADASSVLLGSGQLYHGTSMELLGTLPVTVTDAAWSNGRWHTLSSGSGGAKIQTWSPTDRSLQQSVTVGGTPLRLFALSGNRLLVITSRQGFLQFRELTSVGLEVSSFVDTEIRPTLVDGDLNDDGHADILLQNLKTGQRRGWLLNGTDFLDDINLGSLPVGWMVMATADFNGDYLPDLLMQNELTGERRIRYMRGGTILGETTLGVVPMEWSIAAAADFNGDSRPDVLWQNTSTGLRYIWFMNDATVIGDASLGSLPVDWWITAAADFNEDGKPDIIWQHAVTGLRYIWFMNGTVIASQASLGTVHPDWSIVGAADYNGDGKPDLLWHNLATSQGYIWFMNGTTTISETSLGALPTGWSVSRPVATKSPAAPNDFNDDGFADILWQNAATGLRYLWFMNGTSIAGEANLGTMPQEWSFVATADFNQDKVNDILMENRATGERQIRLMNGVTTLNDVSLGIVAVDWHIVAAADFNDDHHPDIVWENVATGQRYLWYMNDTTPSGDADLGVVTVDWHIVAAADFNGDGGNDLFWEHAVTGQRYVWFMNGATIESEADLGTVASDWHVVAATDLDNDGNADLIWEHAVTGQRYVWFLSGTTTIGEASLGSVSPDWSIVN